MRTRAYMLSAVALLTGAIGPACGQTIPIRMSVKIIVHPTAGTRPPGITPQTFTNAVTAANNLVAGYARGYRYQLTEVVNIGGPSQGGTNGPSRWYNTEFRSDPARAQFFSMAQTDSRYLLRSDRINIYVATAVAQPGQSGGAMPIPPGETNYTGGQIYADDGYWWIVHELGHFFGLRHTFDDEVGSPTCSPGDDGLSDTLPDSNCWTNSNSVARYYFQNNYADLSASEREQVDNVYFNIMSYHEAVNKNIVENRLTELQLDRITLHANTDRHAFVGGFTRFVSLTGNNANSGLNGAAPKRTVLNAVAASTPAGGDIVLLRPGSYNEQITINKPLTLRATRAGWATLGRP